VYADSTCFGITSKGRIEAACKLPASGENFVTYSSMLRTVGRTYVHCTVQKVMLDAYAILEQTRPDSVYVYAETGKKNGGPFKPHKTHQNGLSVDFMVPVVDESGVSVPLPTSVFNKFGYDIEFSKQGKFDDLSIDYEAMADHIAALKQAAAANGIGIWRVIFDPQMQPDLHATRSWEAISDLEFSKKQSWVRHDEHYHVDFLIPCEAL
jgi:penicillin-insensitive murein endopeptidase